MVHVPDSLWIDILEFINQRVDIRDGEDGIPLPNEAMSLAQRITNEYGIDEGVTYETIQDL